MPIKFHEMNLYHHKLDKLAQQYGSSLAIGSSTNLVEARHQELLKAAAIYRKWSELRDQLQEVEVVFRAELKEELAFRQNRLDQKHGESRQNQA